MQLYGVARTTDGRARSYQRAVEVKVSDLESIRTNNPHLAPPPPARPLAGAVWVCRLREVRAKARVSVPDVARSTGLSRNTLYNIERGGDLLLSTARQLAELFGEPIEALWRPRPPRRQRRSRRAKGAGDERADGGP